MANCKQCGAPLTKGNIKFVRKPGKRPYRVCRRCRYPDEVEVTRVGDKRRSFVRPPSREDGRPDLTVLEDFVQAPSEAIQTVKLAGNIESTGNALQRPQVSTGDPLVAEGILEHLDPPKYRYFVTRATAEKVQRAIKGGQVGITVEVMPVPEYQVEANPEALGDYVEINFSHYAVDH